MATDWTDPARRVSELRTEIRRLRARAERWGAPATAAALEDALARSETDMRRREPPAAE